MKIIFNKIIPFGSYSTINLFGVLFTKSTYLSDKTLNHEAIHSVQMKEMFYIGFYIWYIIEHIIRLFQYKNQKDAYYAISFEKEVYENDDNLDYLKDREVFSWWKYLV
jgi:hypothetical protein